MSQRRTPQVYRPDHHQMAILADSGRRGCSGAFEFVMACDAVVD